MLHKCARASVNMAISYYHYAMSKLNALLMKTTLAFEYLRRVQSAGMSVTIILTIDTI